MKLTSKLILKTAFLCAGFSAAIVLLLSFFEFSNFRNAIQKQVNSEIMHSSRIIEDNYTLGDLISLRRYLNEFAKLNHWESGTLKDRNSDNIWIFGDADTAQHALTPMEILIFQWCFPKKQLYLANSNLLFSQSAKVHFVNNLLLGELQITRNVNEEWARYVFDDALWFGIFTLSTIVFLVIQLRITKKTLKPLLRLNADLQKEADIVGISLSKAEEDELQMVRQWFSEVANSWKVENRRASERGRLAALGEVAVKVAHDIRGPLSSMQTAVGYFSEMKVEDKKFGEVLNLLQLSAKRLTGVADGLLKKHQGVAETSNTFSLYKVLDELVGEYNSQCPEVKFNKEYSSQAIELHGNSDKLQRGFGNIIKNAVEAMQFRGSITLRTELKDNKVVVSISDTGPGMSPEKLKKVLNGGYTEGKKGGNGIGMTVVREAVKEHGGEIAATSAIGKGTTFFITMPLLVKDQTQIVIQIEEGKPVIVIDDDPSLREQWRLILQEQGRQTLLCDSYEDFQSQKITPIISHTATVDYHYDNSELNGGDVIRRLKEQGFTNLYLCTAEYWKPSIQKLAAELNVTLCPKPLPQIVIEKQGVIANLEGVKQSPDVSNGDCFAIARNDKQNTGYHVLVIDDDPSIQMSWDLMQEKLGIAELHCYSNMEAMQSNEVDLQNIDIAFVDKNIEGSAFTGADVLAFLKTHCSGKIVLASGENEQTLRQDPQFSQADFIIQDKIPASLSRFFG